MLSPSLSFFLSLPFFPRLCFFNAFDFPPRHEIQIRQILAIVYFYWFELIYFISLIHTHESKQFKENVCVFSFSQENWISTLSSILLLLYNKVWEKQKLFSLSLSSFLLFFQVSQKRYINTSFKKKEYKLLYIYIYILCGLLICVIFFAFLILVEDVRWENNLMFQTPRPFIYLQCSSKLYFLLQ